MGVFAFVGAVLFGFVLGLSCSVFFAVGFIARGRAERGQPLIGKPDEHEVVVNTDDGFVEELERGRQMSGLKPFLNYDEEESEA